MNLIKSSYYSFISTVFKMLSALVINKAVAYFIGPSGLALIGQFQNFSQIATTAAQGAINTGIIKYTSEYRNDKDKLTTLFSNVLKISLVCSAATGLTLVCFSRLLAVQFLNSVNYYYIFIVFGVTITMFTLNGLLLSILNGLQEIKIFIKVNIIQSLYSLVFTTALVWFFGIHGALLALATNQSLIFFVLLFILRKHQILNIKNFKGAYCSKETLKLLKFSMMAFISAIINPVSLIIIRNHLTTNYGIVAAGQWQAVWYISAMYLLVVTTTLGIYYLPKLSSITDKGLLKKEILLGYKTIMPIVILSTILIFVCKDFIIQILFSKDFLPIRNLFLFQLIGDLFKLMAWLLSYIMLAKAMTKIFIVTEIVFVSSFVFLSYLFCNKYGVIGVTYAYAANYFLYLLCMVFVFRKLLF